MRLWIVAGLLVACARPLPEHLRIEPEAEEVDMPDMAVSDLASAVAATIGSDPLGRSPRLLPPSIVEPLRGSRPLIEFAEAVQAVERNDGTVEGTMQQLEAHRGASVAVPLSRGYRLRIAENHLAAVARNPGEAQDALISLLSALRAVNADLVAPRPAMAWIATSPTPALLRVYADRWVLQGWLADPSVPVEVVGPLLAAPQYDALGDTPLGTLLSARASGATGEVDEGVVDLARATELALQQAAADRDREQAAWADARAAAKKELGTEDPIAFLLERARSRLTSAAADDRALGGALLAFSAQRWTGTCEQAPCIGIDRVEAMTFAGRWSPEIEALAAAWRVIALKESMDTLDVGHDTALFPSALVGMVDALLGTGGGPLGAQLLRKGRPDSQVWLELGRAVGEDGVVDWEGTRVAVGRHLQGVVTRTLALDPPDAMRASLERIGRRAIP